MFEEEYETLPGLAEIMERQSCVTPDLCAFWVFLEFCEAASIDEKPELDGQCSCSQGLFSCLQASFPHVDYILGVWDKHICSGDLASQAITCFLF